tara:strand:- start:185 stop:628 length:444 start_codon:yes stop_codon:yes gene_type:complete
MNIFRTLEEESLIKKDLELQKKGRKLNELSKFIEEKIIEFNLNIGKTNLKEVSKHAKLIEIKYTYLTGLIRDIELKVEKSEEIEKNLIEKVNEKIKYIENLQKDLNNSIILRNNNLKQKELMLIKKEKELERKEKDLLEKQKFLFNN